MTAIDRLRELPDDELLDLLNKHGTLQGVVREFTDSNHNEYLRKYLTQRIKHNNIDWVRFRGAMSKRYTPQDIENAFKSAICWSDVFKLLKMTTAMHNKKSIVNYARHHNIPVPEFSKEQLTEAYRRGKETEWTHDTIFCLDSQYSRPNIRRTVIKHNILPTYLCSECGLEPRWNNKDLTLDLDHINGDHTDNRIENLRWLCPNCHSQTLTFKGKNK